MSDARQSSSTRSDNMLPGCVGEVADRCFGTQAVFRVSFAVVHCYLCCCTYLCCFYIGLWSFLPTLTALYTNNTQTVFFGIVLLLSLASSDLFRAYWGPKLFLWAALVVASFFIPNQVHIITAQHSPWLSHLSCRKPPPSQFFNVYADIARVVGALFLLLVVVILIDFAYTLQEWIEDKASAYEDSLRDEVTAAAHHCLLVRLSLTLL